MRNRGSDLRIVGWIVGWKFCLCAAKLFGMMVARDGDEPPTPAFSDLVQPTPLTTYRFAGNCQLPANTIVEFLGDTNADVFILQEVDVNARRTHHLNIAQEIARKLRLNYVFGREFVELTQGSRSNPAFHGQATLSPWKISKPRIIHFQRQSDFWKPRWFKPTLSTFQERLGGRVALACEISTQGVSIVSYNLHLESRFQ